MRAALHRKSETGTRPGPTDVISNCVAKEDGRNSYFTKLEVLGVQRLGGLVQLAQLRKAPR